MLERAPQLNIPYWRLSSLYFFYFALLGAIIPFWNLYLSENGLNAQQIGLLGGILMGTKIISPYLIGLLSDRSENPMKIIHWTNLFALIGFAVLFLIPDIRRSTVSSAGQLNEQSIFLFLCLVVFIWSFFWNGVIAQYEAITLLHLGKEYHRYGLIRVWGSLGFIVAVIALGKLIELTSINIIPVTMLLMFLAIWASSLTLRDLCPTRRIDEHANNKSFLGILKKQHVLAVIAVCFLVKFSFATYYTFYTIYLIDYGYSESMIGLLWGVSVFAELILFFYAGRIITSFRISRILLLCVIAGVIRWLFIAFQPGNLTVLILMQCLHAIVFALYHATAIEWVRRAFGISLMGQGQALYSAVSFGLGGAIGALVCGYLWTNDRSFWWDVNWYISAGALVIAALVIVLVKLPKSIEYGE